jgi:hypothetical protein
LITDLGRGPVGLDTVVFIYFMEEHHRFLSVVAPVFSAVASARLRAITSGITLLETLVIPYRSGNSALAARYEALLTRSRGIRFVDPDRRLLRSAAHLPRTLLRPDTGRAAACCGARQWVHGLPHQRSLAAAHSRPPDLSGERLRQRALAGRPGTSGPQASTTSLPSGSVPLLAGGPAVERGHGVLGPAPPSYAVGLPAGHPHRGVRVSGIRVRFPCGAGASGGAAGDVDVIRRRWAAPDDERASGPGKLWLPSASTVARRRSAGRPRAGSGPARADRARGDPARPRVGVDCARR